MQTILAKIKELENKIESSSSSVEKLFLQDELNRCFTELGKFYYKEIRE